MTLLPLHREPKFTQWTDLGQLTFTPDDTNTVVGSLQLDPEHDTIWVRIRSLTSPSPWPWSYGILGWLSSEGYELGTCKAYPDENSVVHCLGTGLSPMERGGVITFEPRSFNLAWIKKGNPWTLAFEARSGVASSGGAPVFGTRATLTTLASANGAALDFLIRDGYAGITYP